MNIYDAMQLSSSIDEKIKKFNKEVENTSVNISAHDFLKNGLIIHENIDEGSVMLLDYAGDLHFSFKGSSSGEGGFFSGDMNITFKKYRSLRTALFANFGK